MSRLASVGWGRTGKKYTVIDVLLVMARSADCSLEKQLQATFLIAVVLGGGCLLMECTEL